MKGQKLMMITAKVECIADDEARQVLVRLRFR